MSEEEKAIVQKGDERMKFEMDKNTFIKLVDFVEIASEYADDYDNENDLINVSNLLFHIMRREARDALYEIPGAREHAEKIKAEDFQTFAKRSFTDEQTN